MLIKLINSWLSAYFYKKDEEMTIHKIREIFESASLKTTTEFTDAWNEFAKEFGVISKHHEDMLLATIYHEVGSSLISRRENLNYTPRALRSTFLRYKNNPKWSERDGRTSKHKANQVNIGNIAYADRIGNGDIDSGDGYRFRGGSFIQTTGKANWKQAAKTISMLTGEKLDAENLEAECHTTKIGLLMAFAFFFDKDIASCDTMDCCTDKVNKHTKSREARNKTYYRIKSIGRESAVDAVGE